ncbi:MAG: methyltransferase domain-containing protein [Thermoleophilia bacterium]|nr:methyltransferase domain-containing protein [Thermoleophilia bacterium]
MSDRWAEWLLERRFGGDEAVKRRFLERLTATRDRVLDNAGLAAGETLLDVGCGDGLIAFGALARGAGRVVFADVSAPLLTESRRIAEELGLLERCTFVQAAAEELGAIDDASVDVVTTRSVLIYVKEKARAVGEFFRVLRPGGRMSLFEPVNAYFPVDRDRLVDWDAAALRPLVDRVRAVYETIQPPGEDPMLDFDERELLALAERAGFAEVHLELRADVVPTEPETWEAVARRSGNPKIPTLEEALAEALTREERERVVAHVRPLVERGEGTSRLAVAYLWARKA